MWAFTIPFNSYNMLFYDLVREMADFALTFRSF